MHWDFPVYQATEEPRQDGTSVRAARTALPRAEALRCVAGTDARPLLVLRECARCNKTDDALLTPGWDNERVLFLSRWFHCVKLPIDVVQPEHPFHALFPGDESEHLFLSTRDGALKIPLESSTSRVELCSSMSKVLAAAYAKDPSPLFKELHALGDRLDVLDQHAKELEAKKAELMETAGKNGDKQKLAKLEAEIASTKKDIGTAIAGFEKLARVELKPAAPEKKKP